MQRARENAEGEFSNFGTNRKHYSNLSKALGMDRNKSAWLTFIDDCVQRIKIVIVCDELIIRTRTSITKERLWRDFALLAFSQKA